MRKYLSTIHKKSDTHKKRFALGVSASFTLIIFVIWSAVVFKSEPELVVNEGGLQPVQLAGANAAVDQIETESPFRTVSQGLNEALNVIKDGVSETKNNIKSIDVNSEYQQVKSEALPTSNYGQ